MDSYGSGKDTVADFNERGSKPSVSIKVVFYPVSLGKVYILSGPNYSSMICFIFILIDSMTPHVAYC
jgi:hypothetical protein